MKAITTDIDEQIAGVKQHAILPGFEENYLNIRNREGRIYTDEIVARLPMIDRRDSHFDEWKLRQQSTRRLIRYIEKKEKPLKILDIGCGNGWLSYRISLLPGTSVTAIDINCGELNQARRIFGKPNLHFLHADIKSSEIQPVRFDLILFAASIQYFNPLQAVISDALKLLKPDGEIHIVDSHFYQRGELDAAKKRTADYYQTAGVPEMTKRYFHHDINGLKQFNNKVLHKPSGFKRFFQKQNPFTWFCITR